MTRLLDQVAYRLRSVTTGPRWKRPLLPRPSSTSCSIDTCILVRGKCRQPDVGVVAAAVALQSGEFVNEVAANRAFGKHARTDLRQRWCNGLLARLAEHHAAEPSG